MHLLTFTLISQYIHFNYCTYLRWKCKSEFRNLWLCHGTKSVYCASVQIIYQRCHKLSRCFYMFDNAFYLPVVDSFPGICTLQQYVEIARACYFTNQKPAVSPPDCNPYFPGVCTAACVSIAPSPH